MNDVTDAKLENEIEWRKIMYNEIKEARNDLKGLAADLNTFKIATNNRTVKSTKLMIGIGAILAVISNGITNYLTK